MPSRVRFTVPLPLIRVGLWTLPVAAYSSLALFKWEAPFIHVPNIPLGIDAALSFAMALIIAFRVNRAYERWWEARILWGTLVNVSRNLAVKVHHLYEIDVAERQQVRDVIVAFATGLKDHLRDEVDLKKLPGFESDLSAPQHVPSHIAAKLYGMFHRWKSEGKINDQQIWVLDSEARILLDVCGACERIKNTLMSISWRTFTWQCIAVYLLVLPWGMVEDFGLWTIPLTSLVAYFVIAGEGIAHYVEEPFGRHEDHIDLEGIVRAIDVSVSEVLSKQTELNASVSSSHPKGL